jgi:hypothetical protein
MIPAVFAHCPDRFFVVFFSLLGKCWNSILVGQQLFSSQSFSFHDSSVTLPVDTIFTQNKLLSSTWKKKGNPKPTGHLSRSYSGSTEINKIRNFLE